MPIRFPDAFYFWVQHTAGIIMEVKTQAQGAFVR